MFASPAPPAARDFADWLLGHLHPGGPTTYDADPLAALALDVCAIGGSRLPTSPAALAVLLRRTGASPATHAAAALAVRRYLDEAAEVAR